MIHKLAIQANGESCSHAAGRSQENRVHLQRLQFSKQTSRTLGTPSDPGRSETEMKALIISTRLGMEKSEIIRNFSFVLDCFVVQSAG